MGSLNRDPHTGHFNSSSIAPVVSVFGPEVGEEEAAAALRTPAPTDADSSVLLRRSAQPRRGAGTGEGGCGSAER